MSQTIKTQGLELVRLKNGKKELIIGGQGKRYKGQSIGGLKLREGSGWFTPIVRWRRKSQGFYDFETIIHRRVTQWKLTQTRWKLTYTSGPRLGGLDVTITVIYFLNNV